MSGAEFGDQVAHVTPDDFGDKLKPAGSGESLGSLAQAARSNHLKSARGTMYAIGVLTVVANLFVLGMAKSMVDGQVDKELKTLQGQGMQIDMMLLEQLKADAVKTTQLTAAGMAGLGVIFLVLGAFVYRHPVPCTVLALVLYVAGNAITAVLDPTTVARGIVIKIIIVVALAKAIQAALAYRREQLATAS